MYVFIFLNSIMNKFLGKTERNIRANVNVKYETFLFLQSMRNNDKQTKIKMKNLLDFL